MPQYIGGDITEIVCKHSLGTFRFQAKSNEDFTINTGGFRSNDDANGITGGGEMIDQVNNTRWSMEGPIAVDMKSGNESVNLQKLAESAELGIWTITHVSGVVQKGKGKPVGDLNYSTNNAQMTLKVAGSGKLENL
ncbi:hypothetical protein C7967_11541 [Thalassospira sp. 11-3]|nr:hypothetical protein C7967_11541 [Thalassospira sp. 11-3]